MPRDRVQTRLPADRYEAVTEYRKERDISEAEATRRLIYAGLDAAGEDADEDTDEDAGEDAGGDQLEAVADGGRLVTTRQFTSTMRLQNVALASAVVYVGALATDVLSSQEAIAGGLVVLAVLVASLVFVGDVGDVDE